MYLWLVVPAFVCYVSHHEVFNNFITQQNKLEQENIKLKHLFQFSILPRKQDHEILVALSIGYKCFFPFWMEMAIALLSTTLDDIRSYVKSVTGVSFSSVYFNLAVTQKRILSDDRLL